jgi:hypothetical protein
MIQYDNFLGHTLDKDRQEEISEALKNCTSGDSYYYFLNIIYNNFNHFNNNSYAYDTQHFLTEISNTANSINDTLIVMGGIHSDDGHSSSLIINENKSVNQFVSDTYIRFTIKLKNQKKLFVLNESQIFHFLVNVPQINWISGNNKKETLFIQNIPQNFDKRNAEMYYPNIGPNIKQKIVLKRVFYK